jgi:hypothetical protein
MANMLFVVVENLRQYHGSSPSQGSVLHLVYEFAKHNKGMRPTRNHEAPQIQRQQSAADPRREAFVLCYGPPLNLAPCSNVMA